MPMKSKKRKRMIVLFLIFGLLVAGIFAFLNHPLFGKSPSGERLERIKNNPHYKNETFHNISHTPSLAEDVSYWQVFKDMLFSKVENTRPNDSIPYVNTDISQLDITADYMVWFGHSSYFIQADEKKFLIDPVLTKNASPIYGTNVAFKGADTFRYDNIPAIDFLIITHDHYDHLDYTTFKNIQHKVSKIVCPLGVGEHLEYWGYAPENIIELEWWENMPLTNEITITATPTRHFSGRGFKRNNTLWASYALQTSKLKMYLGGDSGYDNHFKEIGEKHGPFDLAILENGQYNYKWKYIHLMPKEVIQAAKDLQAKAFFPVHSAKFKLADHPWKEPLEQVALLHKQEENLNLFTPKIGEVVYLNDTEQNFDPWWEEVE